MIERRASKKCLTLENVTMKNYCAHIVNWYIFAQPMAINYAFGELLILQVAHLLAVYEQ